ncbi:MAG: radical SAM protein [Thermotogota bacterium]|nr:radical SAM protein [Thermotogota bacterium]
MKSETLINKYVYGIVPSRRLGRSLGVSPIPFKTCNHSCIYCQLGRTTRMINTRTNFFPHEEIIDEVRKYVQRVGEEAFDVVTIVGEGEPLLYKPIDKLIEKIKIITSKPLVVITNGTFLMEKEVREEISDSDVVMPTLDAWDEESYRRINRPHKDLHYDDFYNGLVEFSHSFRGEVWLEVMIMKNINDSYSNIRRIGRRIKNIDPDRVYINVPVRPPAEKYVDIPDKAEIDFAKDVFKAESIEKIQKGDFSSLEEDALQGVIQIIKRHPMKESEIKQFVLSMKDENEFQKVLERLHKHNNVEIIEKNDQRFFRFKFEKED